MKSGLWRQKTLIILFISIIMLLVADIIITKKYTHANHSADNAASVSGPELDSLFRLALNSFGIEPGWVKGINKAKQDGDSLFKSYRISVPADLTIPELLVGIFSGFNEVNAKLECSELKSGGETELKIYSGDYLKLKASLIYGRGIRKQGAVGIIVEDFKFTDRDDSLLIGIPEPFCVLLKPDSRSADQTELIRKSNKEYTVLLDDNISELKFKLSAGYSKNRILGSLKSIVGNFYNAIFFLIDQDSKIFNSENGTLVLTELDRRKIKHTKLSDLTPVAEIQGSDIKSKFENFINSEERERFSIILLNRDELKELLPSILSQRKKGVKFLNPSDVYYQKTLQKIQAE